MQRFLHLGVTERVPGWLFVHIGCRDSRCYCRTVLPWLRLLGLCKRQLSCRTRDLSSLFHNNTARFYHYFATVICVKQHGHWRPFLFISFFLYSFVIFLVLYMLVLNETPLKMITNDVLLSICSFFY